MVRHALAGLTLLGLTGLGMTVASCVAGERPAVDHIACEGSTCACMPGFGNCDNNPINGCEAILDVDQDHCGACGLACTNGRCDSGSCSCNDGFVDCNQDSADGCEALLALDADNCGGCGRSCLGGACGQSRCEPYLLAELGTYIYTLAVDAEAVYFCEAGAGALYRVSKETGELTPIAFDQNCYEIAAADGQLFWSVREHGEEFIRVMPVGGGSLRTIAVARDVLAFAVGEDHAVWSEYDSIAAMSYLYAADMSGTVTTLTSTAADITFATVANGQAFWVQAITGDSSTIMRAPIGGGTAAAVTTVERILVAFTVIGDDIYFLEANDDGGEPTIFRVPASGGTPTGLYARNRQVDTLIGDETGLYWTEDEGDRLVRAPLDGGEVEILALYQDITLPVLGANAIYWRDYPSHLFALAK